MNDVMTAVPVNGANVSPLSIQPNCFDLSYRMGGGKAGVEFREGISVANGVPRSVFVGDKTTGGIEEYLRLDTASPPKIYNDGRMLRCALKLERDPTKPHIKHRSLVTSSTTDEVYVKISTGNRAIKSSKVMHGILAPNNRQPLIGGMVKSKAGNVVSYEGLWRLSKGDVVHVVFVDGSVYRVSFVKDKLTAVPDPEKFAKLKAEAEAEAQRRQAAIETAVRVAAEAQEQERVLDEQRRAERQEKAWEAYIQNELKLEEKSPALERIYFERVLNDCPFAEMRKRVCEKVMADGVEHLRALDVLTPKDVYIAHTMLTAAEHIDKLDDVAREMRKLEVNLPKSVMGRLPKEPEDPDTLQAREEARRKRVKNVAARRARDQERHATIASRPRPGESAQNYGRKGR
ncbi:hypothetical protein A2671_01380 [Candidatus Kaiserbacteria bacterium RIFCSPHIGHO2_01_FULL_49_13]|uniref:Uncharacterized protein n=1 Tax=Candidatus Kaiserbacteria bacterium RIFCSPHIGHO2_01_FULL_49_13 TaxID=1798477 RepID=A0A1F6CDS5_9BACT|nr:MAG: hypothetical protein A2671_01380 [Candidatus Kaiserbacteria bacterium RIFCSPHIGHO2_01_FULL_49_13]